MSSQAATGHHGPKAVQGIPSEETRASGATPYDALLLVSFGGPEGMADVSPFLDHVLRGRNVPPERRREVAHHYERFGGVSPINAQNRALLDALRVELDAHGPRLPLYWGNRNWHPFLADTLRAMAGDGVRRALAFVTSAYSSYSGCRQYLEDIARARAEVGPSAPAVDKLRAFHDHPGFVEANVERVREALETLPADRRPRRGSRSPRTASRPRWRRAPTTSRSSARRARWWRPGRRTPSGRSCTRAAADRPSEPWLEPDILDHLDALRAEGATDVVVAPVGFVSDHMEVVYDLDTEARERAAALGLAVRAGRDGGHAPGVRADGPRADPGARGGRRAARAGSGARAPTLRARLLRAGLLPVRRAREPPCHGSRTTTGRRPSPGRLAASPSIRRRVPARAARWARIAARRSASGISRRSADRWRVVEVRQRHPGEPGADGPLDGAEIRFLARRDEREGVAPRLGPRGPAHAVDVVLGQRRDVEVHHVAQGVDVDAPRGDVGGHQHLEAAALEARQGLRPLGLAAVPVDPLHPDPVLRPRNSASRFARCLVRVKASTLRVSGRPRSARSRRDFSSDATG